MYRDTVAIFCLTAGSALVHVTNLIMLIFNALEDQWCVCWSSAQLREGRGEQ